jgi:hypothetical protein
MSFANIDQLKAYLHRVVDAAEKLVLAVIELPLAEEDGTPDGSIQRSKVAEIKALQQVVEDHYARFPDCLKFLDQVIRRLETSRGAVAAGRGKLHNENVRARFSQAQRILEAEYRRAVRIRGTLMTLIYVVRQILEMAAERGFPGRGTWRRGDLAAL